MPAAAQAQVGHIAGNPLDVYADGTGRLQFRFNGQTAGVFYDPASEQGNAGLALREGDQYSPPGSATPAEGPTLQTIGAGTRALHSVYTAGNLRVTEDVTYTDRTQAVDVRYVIANVSGVPVTFSAGALADLYAAGSDNGRGVIETGPPRFVGGLSANGALTGLVERTPWSHYQSGHYSEIFFNFSSGALNDQVDADVVDNGVGAQWDFNDVAPGDSRTIDVSWRLGEPTQATVVTTTSDGDDQCTPTDCTLREAIATAPAGTVIDVPAGTYTLDPQLGELTLRGVALRGAGAGATTVTGGGQSRVFAIFGEQAFLSRMRITGGQGQDGGGIHVGGESALTLTDVAVTDNRAAGAGGGIYSEGELTVARSVIARNESAQAGGGLALGGGSASVTNTTLSANAAARGGGIYSSGPPELLLLNSTVAANRDGAGLYVSAPALRGANDAVTVQNTIIAGNTGGACAEDTPGHSGHSLADDRSCDLAGPGDRQAGDARLQPLAAGGVHALGAGSQALDAADGALCPLSDQLGTPRPQGTACDIGAYELPIAEPEETTSPTPEPTPTPAPPPPPVPQLLPNQPQDELPPPVVGKAVNAQTKSGTVRIKLPGKKRYVELGPGEQVPVGTTIDARKGRITLTSAADRRGGTQTADFYLGIFRVRQTGGARPITDLQLVETLSCRKKGARANAAAKKKKTSRKLWGSGKGRFRTTGKYSSATVRGTVWLTQDRCTTTLTRVTKGSVSVRDKVKRKTVLVRKGKRYTARAKRR
jgi:CSLREA domain-containing protein